MDIFIIILSVISLISIALGFIALLTQKIYIIDSQTQSATEVETIFGKMKTNYPALVFVVLGFGLLYLTLDKKVISDKNYDVSIKNLNDTLDKKNKIIGDLSTKAQWQIMGRLMNGDDTHIEDFSNCIMTLHPTVIEDDEVSTLGVFNIKISLEKGKIFEDWIDYIAFDDVQGGGSVHIRKDSLENYIDSPTESTYRKYKPFKMSHK